MTPRLSIIITAHNCAAWLQETLDGVIASAGAALARCEIIIINDASSDETQKITERCAQRYTQVRYDQTALRNIGLVRNHAISLASGDYILMIDGDDKPLPDAIADHLAVLDAESPDIFLSKIIEVRAQDNVPAWQYRSPVALMPEEAISRFLIHRDFQAHFIGQYFRRDLLMAHPFPPYICYEDAWLFPQLLINSEKILYCSAGFYLYRKHAASLSTRMNAEKIACLLAATAHMDEVLPARFGPLITCHWIDVLNRHADTLRQLGEWDKVKARIARQGLMSFLLNRKIRLSHKRKMLKVRRLR